MRHAIARSLFIGGVVLTLGFAACSTPNSSVPLAVGGQPNGTSGGQGGVATAAPNILVPGPTPTPTPSPVPTAGAISVTANGTNLSGTTFPGLGSVTVTVSVPNYTGLVFFNITSCTAPAAANVNGQANGTQATGSGPTATFTLNNIAGGATCSYTVTAGTQTATGTFTP